MNPYLKRKFIARELSLCRTDAERQAVKSWAKLEWLIPEEEHDTIRIDDKPNKTSHTKKIKHRRMTVDGREVFILTE